MLSDAIDMINLGGPVVWLLVLFSVFATTIFLAKLLQFWTLRPSHRGAAEQALDHFAKGEQAQALMLAKGQANPRVRLIGQAITLIEDSQLGSEDLRKEMLRRARLAISNLAGFIRPLEVIATLAPLLGLFGTVIGMIEAFQAMEAAGSQVNPSVLSGGIWVALLTTAVGLAVAIPVTVAHSWLERRVESQAELIQNDLDYLLTLHKSKAERQSEAQARLKRA